MKNSAVFKLMQKCFCREISILNSTRPAPTGDKSYLYVHAVDELQPQADVNNPEEKAINDG